MLERAEQVDAREAESEDGSRLPAELVRAQNRRRAIKQATEALEVEQKHGVPRLQHSIAQSLPSRAESGLKGGFCRNQGRPSPQNASALFAPEKF